MPVFEPGGRHESTAGSSAFAAWRLLRASSDVLADHTAATLDLLILEWQAERSRVLQLLFLAFIAIALLLLLVAFGGLFLLAAVWETPFRIPAAGGLLLVFAGGAWLALQKAKSLSVTGVQPFATLRNELAKDRELIRSQTHEVQ